AGRLCDSRSRPGSALHDASSAADCSRNSPQLPLFGRKGKTFAMPSTFTQLKTEPTNRNELARGLSDGRAVRQDGLSPPAWARSRRLWRFSSHPRLVSRHDVSTFLDRPGKVFR